MAKSRILADTNVILEAFRTGCWKAISHHFSVETVEKCVEETLTGDLGNPRHIEVSGDALREKFTVHPVSTEIVRNFFERYPKPHLDDGEQHLLAWLHAQDMCLPQQDIWVATADKAALVALHNLGRLGRTISLEKLARDAGIHRSKLDGLNEHFREGWLSTTQTQIKLGINI